MTCCTTLNRVRAKGPCEDGWKKLLKHLGKTKADDELLPFAVIVESNEELRAALAELTARCDGEEGVRADGSNIQTMRAHAALYAAPPAQPAAELETEQDWSQRYRPVKGSFWWHYVVGNGTQRKGKFYTEIAAKEACADLLTAFLDGKYVGENSK
jgi:hypothetical protein